jgi:hypothetical protein
VARPELGGGVGNVALQLRVDGPPVTGKIEIGDVVVVAKNVFYQYLRMCLVRFSIRSFNCVRHLR